jgi:hypothetical protein
MSTAHAHITRAQRNHNPLGNPSRNAAGSDTRPGNGVEVCHALALLPILHGALNILMKVMHEIRAIIFIVYPPVGSVLR